LIVQTSFLQNQENLKEWLAHKIKYDTVRKNGGTRRQALEKVERQSGRKITELEDKVKPKGSDFYLMIFFQVSSSRSYDMNGNPESIKWTELQAWLQLHNVTLNPWELQLITALDAVYIAEVHQLKEDS
jgi:hypothetical protein